MKLTKVWIRLEIDHRHKRKGSERKMERAAKEHRKNIPALQWAPQQSADWLFNRAKSMACTLIHAIMCLCSEPLIRLPTSSYISLFDDTNNG